MKIIMPMARPATVSVIHEEVLEMKGRAASASKGLAPAMVQSLIAALNELKATATTVLLVEQNFSVARALGDGVAVMDSGTVMHRGAMAELAEDEALQSRLLGLSLGAHQ